MVIKKTRINQKNASGGYDIFHPETTADQVLLPDGNGTVATHLADLTYQVATGTGTALTVPMGTLVNGYSKTFIASVTSTSTTKTINGKPFYKPGTTVSPSLVAAKAYTVWYNATSDCFFIKASAEGTATTAQVLAGVPFSNETDTGLIGTIPIQGAQTITPTTYNHVIQANRYLGGAQVILGDGYLMPSNIKQGIKIFDVIGNLIPANDRVITGQIYITDANVNFNIPSPTEWGLNSVVMGGFFCNDFPVDQCVFIQSAASGTGYNRVVGANLWNRPETTGMTVNSSRGGKWHTWYMVRR